MMTILTFIFNKLYVCGNARQSHTGIAGMTQLTFTYQQIRVVKFESRTCLISCFEVEEMYLVWNQFLAGMLRL